ncbi:phosphoadenosine phosphosulfate reductase family protein [Aeromonas caviae]
MNHNIVSVSGGKDSTATLLLAIERNAENLQAVFCDTGHEHPEVYAYLDYLERRLRLTIRRVKPDFSQQVIAKRTLVQTKWASDLPELFMADRPGRWVLKSNYARLTGADEDGVYFTLRCPDGSEVDWPAEPEEPADRYATTQSGPFIWLPAVHGMSRDEAQQRTGIIIENALSVLRPTGNPFLDLCLWKGRFPSAMARFCTEELKRNPMQQQVLFPLLEDHDTEEVWCWQGVRADESTSRSKLPEKDEVRDGLINYRPILTWTAQDVFEFHRKHGVKWNPLYEQGLSRVGCMPCIMCRKDELREIANRWPEEIERVAEWERLVSMASKRGASSFYGPRVAGGGQSIEMMTHEEAQELLNINRVIEWSMTGRGGKTFDMFARLGPEVGCSSAYGLCDNPVIDPLSGISIKPKVDGEAA